MIDPDLCYQAIVDTAEMFGWEHLPQCPGHTIWGAVDFGGQVRPARDGCDEAMITTRHPVNEPKDLEHLDRPDPTCAGRIPYAYRFAQLQAINGYPVVFSSRSPLSMAGDICGLGNLLDWMDRSPELVHQAMELALEHILAVLSFWVRSFEAQNIFVWLSSPSESHQAISAQRLADFALPYHAKIHESLTDLGISHFGLYLAGDQNRNLPLFAEADLWPHPSLLALGSDVRLSQAAQHFPRDILFGNLDSNLLWGGSPRQVYLRCRELIDEGQKAPGGFILAPGSPIPPQAAPVKVHAMTKAARDASQQLEC
jgi:uroporphyrinogen-III decarboxylase